MTGLPEEFWETRFQEGRTPWERGTLNPAFLEWRATGVLAPCRVLVPGAGKSPESPGQVPIFALCRGRRAHQPGPDPRPLESHPAHCRIRTGTVTASVIMRQLAAYPRQNGVAAALRELGRLERTLFTLDWIEDPELRRSTGQELNRGDAGGPGLM